MSYSMVRMRCFLVFTRLLFFGSLEWNLFLDIFGIGLKFYFLSQKQLDRSRTMSQNIQICHPPSQKSSHAWGWFPWIPLLVPSHYASEVANVFTQNCSRYVDIALTYHLHSPISFPYVFSVFFHMFPIFFQDPIQSESLEPKRPCRNDHRGEPSANTATNQAPTPRRTATSFSTGLAQKDASKTSPKRDEVLRQSKIWRCFEYQHITKW